MSAPGGKVMEALGHDFGESHRVGKIPLGDFEVRREEGAGLQWDKTSLTLRAAFLLRLAREGRKQESTRSQ